MFWIGLIVGAIVGWFGSAAFHLWYGMRATNMNWDEYTDYCALGVEAGNNRESTITVTHDGEVLNELVLEEE